MIVEELIAKLGYALSGESNLKKWESGLAHAETKANSFASRLGSMAATFGKWSIAAGAAGAAVGSALAIGLGKKVLDVGGSFESLKAQLKVAFEGSEEAAGAAFGKIQDFARTTPYSLQGVTEAFVRLKAYGIDPFANDTMQILGDTASAMGKPIMQAVEAIADAQTGEFERLKEFGIKASKEHGQVTLRWTQDGKQMTKSVKETSDAIRTGIYEIWGPRFKGAMIEQSKTWRGLLSNLGDSWEIFLNQIFESGFGDYMKTQLKGLLDWLDSNQEKITQFAISISEAFINVGKAVGWGVGKAVEAMNLLNRKFREMIGETAKNGDEYDKTWSQIIQERILGRHFEKATKDFKYKVVIDGKEVERIIKKGQWMEVRDPGKAYGINKELGSRFEALLKWKDWGSLWKRWQEGIPTEFKDPSALLQNTLKELEAIGKWFKEDWPNSVRDWNAFWSKSGEEVKKFTEQIIKLIEAVGNLIKKFGELFGLDFGNIEKARAQTAAATSSYDVGTGGTRGKSRTTQGPSGYPALPPVEPEEPLPIDKTNESPALNLNDKPYGSEPDVQPRVETNNPLFGPSKVSPPSPYPAAPVPQASLGPVSVEPTKLTAGVEPTKLTASLGAPPPWWNNSPSMMQKLDLGKGGASSVVNNYNFSGATTVSQNVSQIADAPDAAADATMQALLSRLKEMPARIPAAIA